jgi:ubiquinone biosynthesis protein COQ4
MTQSYREETVMPNVTNPQLLSSFLKMVEADDGDFEVISELAEASADQKSLDLIIQHLSSHPQGQQAFANPFSLGAIDPNTLIALPKQTLGHLYAEHLLQNQLNPLVAQPAENNYQFLGNHLKETHDIWHVITGSKTDILGEIQLEAFCVAQLETSRLWLALLTKNLVKSMLYDIEMAPQYMDALTTGWTMGRTAQPLFGVNWSRQWETPIDQIRASFNIVGVPSY